MDVCSGLDGFQKPVNHQHVSIVRSVKDIQDRDRSIHRKKNNICKLCPDFKPTYEGKANRHYHSHISSGVEINNGYRVLACHRNCRDHIGDGHGHYHCPSCGKTLARKDLFQDHWDKKCSKQFGARNAALRDKRKNANSNSPRVKPKMRRLAKSDIPPIEPETQGDLQDSDIHDSYEGTQKPSDNHGQTEQNGSHNHGQREQHGSHNHGQTEQNGSHNHGQTEQHGSHNHGQREQNGSHNHGQREQNGSRFFKEIQCTEGDASGHEYNTVTWYTEKGNVVTHATDDIPHNGQRTMNLQPIDDDPMKAIEVAQNCLVRTRHDYTDLSGRYDPNGENAEQPMINLQELLVFKSTPPDKHHPWMPMSEIIDKDINQQIVPKLSYLSGYFPEHEEKEGDPHLPFAFENTAEIEKLKMEDLDDIGGDSGFSSTFSCHDTLYGLTQDKQIQKMVLLDDKFIPTDNMDVDDTKLDLTYS